MEYKSISIRKTGFDIRFEEKNLFKTHYSLDFDNLIDKLDDCIGRFQYDNGLSLFSLLSEFGSLLHEKMKESIEINKLYINIIHLFNNMGIFGFLDHSLTNVSSNVIIKIIDFMYYVQYLGLPFCEFLSQSYTIPKLVSLFLSIKGPKWIRLASIISILIPYQLHYEENFSTVISFLPNIISKMHIYPNSELVISKLILSIVQSSDKVSEYYSNIIDLLSSFEISELSVPEVVECMIIIITHQTDIIHLIINSGFAMKINQFCLLPKPNIASMRFLLFLVEKCDQASLLSTNDYFTSISRYVFSRNWEEILIGMEFITYLVEEKTDTINSCCPNANVMKACFHNLLSGPFKNKKVSMGLISKFNSINNIFFDDILDFLTQDTLNDVFAEIKESQDEQLIFEYQIFLKSFLSYLENIDGNSEISEIVEFLISELN